MGGEVEMIQTTKCWNGFFAGCCSCVARVWRGE